MSATAVQDRDPRWGDYQGEGIWYACDGCGALHETDEDAEFTALLEQVCSDIGESSHALYEEFGIHDSEGRWDVIPEEGLFKFTDADGRIATAPYGVVSSWNEKSHSWMWAWSFPEEWCPNPPRTAVEKTWEIGAANGWQAVTERLLAVNEHEAWHLTNLVAHLAGWPLVYRARVNDINWHYYAIARPVRAS
jgi:hypothetical protein